MVKDSRILVTGASGFVGRQLVRKLLAERPVPSLFAWAHSAPPENGDDKFQWQVVDIQDPAAVEETVRASRPTHLVHLAAASNVAASFEDPRTTWSVNLMGSLNLLEAVHRAAPHAQCLLVSSSEVYGDSFNSGKPLGEDAPIRPQNPYAASKAAAELVAATYVRRGLQLICVRPFNHIGPGQSDSFAISSFAHQIARIEAGLQTRELEVGNLEAQRDFLDVEDVVSAYIRVLERMGELPSGLILNLCSGIPRRIGDVLAELIELADVPIEVVQDPQRMRLSDIPVAVGKSDLARERLDWSPRMPWRATLERVLGYWRERSIRSPSP